MGSLIEFTNNYSDRSTNTGYQFEFYCDGCGTGLMSPFRASKIGIAGSLLSSASSFLGGFGNATDNAQDMLRGRERDEALKAAVTEMKQHFKLCGRCGKWVCPAACWNDTRNMCEKCAPDLQEEMVAAQNTVTAEHMWRQARQGDMAKNIDMMQPDGKPVDAATCACGAKVTGKFCGECGAEVKRRLTCPNCDADNSGTAKFCGNCGHKFG